MSVKFPFFGGGFGGGGGSADFIFMGARIFLKKGQALLHDNVVDVSVRRGARRPQENPFWRSQRQHGDNKV